MNLSRSTNPEGILLDDIGVATRLSEPKLRRLLALAVAVQVAVPVVALSNGVPSRFGFHMYSGREQVSVEIRDKDGRPVEEGISRWAVNLRPEIDWTLSFPERVCADVAAAHEVVVRTSKRERRLTCPS